MTCLDVVEAGMIVSVCWFVHCLQCVYNVLCLLVGIISIFTCALFVGMTLLLHSRRIHVPVVAIVSVRLI